MFYAANVQGSEIELHHMCENVAMFMFYTFLLTFEAVVPWL